MFVVGLTGGIGSGKSTVTERLQARGAAIVDTDEISRILTGPGGEAMQDVRAAFGARFVTAEGGLDRPAMRALVFEDITARARLEAILHPAIRARGDVPVMMLTARGEEQDLVKALELGADDYLTKPFSPRTLLARVKALLRRASADRAHAPLSSGRVTLDLEGYSVRIGEGDAITLTKLELRLMQMLLAQAGRAVNSDRLLVQVWGHRGSGDRQLLKQLVHRLRQKIEIDPAAPQMLQTAPGAGYKLVVE